VIPNGVELDRFATVREQRATKRAELDLEGGFVILSIARLQPVKGLTDLIGAVALLRDRVDRPLLLVVGGGSQRAELERLVATTGLADLVRLEGEVADPRPYLAAADVFALASTREGLPNALLEAMAAGLPIVATRVGGVPEAVEDGVSGLLVDSADPGALAEAIVHLWRDPELRRRLGANASRRVVERFSAETSFRNFRTVLEGAPSGLPAREFAEDLELRRRSLGNPRLQERALGLGSRPDIRRLVESLPFYNHRYDPEMPYLLNPAISKPALHVPRPPRDRGTHRHCDTSLMRPTLQLGSDAFWTYVIAHPESFLRVAHGLLAVGSAATAGLMCLRAFKLEHRSDVVIALGAGASFFVFLPSYAFSTLSFWTHNSFNFPAGTLLLLLMFIRLRTGKPVQAWEIALAGIATGVDAAALLRHLRFCRRLPGSLHGIGWPAPFGAWSAAQEVVAAGAGFLMATGPILHKYRELCWWGIFDRPPRPTARPGWCALRREHVDQSAWGESKHLRGVCWWSACWPGGLPEPRRQT
jgi:hypothetical protein